MARYNRNPNPAFDVSAAGWATQGTKAPPRRVASTRGDGVSGFIVDARSASRDWAIIYTNDATGRPPVVPGRTYTVSVYVYQGSGSRLNVALDADYYNRSSGAYISTAPASPVVSVANNTWTRLSHTIVAPAGDVLLSTWVAFQTSVDNTYVVVSCAMVEDGATLGSYRDGNSSGWAWTGTRGLSPSQDLDPTARAAVAYIDPGQPVAPGEEVTLTSEGSGNPEGGQVTNVWSVLDAGGTGLTNTDIEEGRFLAFFSFIAPDRPGTITFRLTVTDDNGNTDTDDVSVTVASAGPEPGRMLLGG